MSSSVTNPIVNSGTGTGTGTGTEPTAKTITLPVATHDDVFNNKIKFWESYNAFHGNKDKKKKVPVIGKKRLDLHVLYVEVTKRGGHDKVKELKKWKEVSMVFNFSAKTTSASFILRKHYHRCLLDFEHAYFSGERTTPVPTVPITGQSSFQSTVTINVKFDWGYFASIKLGDDDFLGLLYRPVNFPSTPPPPPNDCREMVLYKRSPNQSGGRRKRMRRYDPNHPKQNRSGYNFFFAEKHSELKAQYMNLEKGEFAKMIGNAWNNLSPEQKQVYQNYGVMDKERYRREKREYGIKCMQREN